MSQHFCRTLGNVSLQSDDSTTVIIWHDIDGEGSLHREIAKDVKLRSRRIAKDVKLRSRDSEGCET